MFVNHSINQYNPYALVAITHQNATSSSRVCLFHRLVAGSESTTATIALRAIITPKPNIQIARIPNGQRNQIQLSLTRTNRKNPASKHNNALRQ